MLNIDNAIQILKEKLVNLYEKSDIELVILENDTIEKSYGWIFFYNAKEFVDTGNMLYARGGNGPVVVLRYSGSVHFLGTARSTDVEIATFERINRLPSK